MTYEVEINGRQFRLELLRNELRRNDLLRNDLRRNAPMRRDATKAAPPSATWTCRINGRELTVDAAQPQPGVLSLLIDGQSSGAAHYEIERERIPTAAPNGEIQLVLRGVRYSATVRDPRALRGRKSAAGRGEGPRKLVAPMPGKIVRMLVPEGTTVAAGQSVLVIEAMKMQNEIKSPKAGVLRKLTAAEGMAVNAGDVLAVVE